MDAGLTMKITLTRQILVAAFILMVLSSMALVQTTKALSFNYSDNFLSTFSVSSNIDIAKPGSSITATVTGQLAVNGQSTIFHIAFSVDTISQSGKVLDERDLVLSNISRTAVAQLIVPSDALNNTYVFATIGNGTIVFSKIPITLIQNPLYSEQQSQIATLQNQLATALANSTTLQNQITILQSDKAALQGQLNSLNATLIGLQSTNSALQQQISILQTNNTNLQSQLSTLQI